MGKRWQLLSLATLVTVGMMFSSCGNIDIVKRKYRPGFHVDITKKKQKPQGKKPASQTDRERSVVEKRQRTVNAFKHEDETATNYRPKIEKPEQSFDETASASLKAKPR